jgi:hypothetical protein
MERVLLERMSGANAKSATYLNVGKKMNSIYTEHYCKGKSAANQTDKLSDKIMILDEK